MMNAAFRELGLDWRYVALPVPPARFDETVRALPGSGYRGANVTIPFKRAAHDLADELSDAAGQIGAVNTLTFGEDGRIAGDNTDAGGFLDALGEPPPTALVLGAGGAGARRGVGARRLRGRGDRVEPNARAGRRARGGSRGERLGATRPRRAAGERHLGRPSSHRLARRPAAGRRERGRRPRLRNRSDAVRPLGRGARSAPRGRPRGARPSGRPKPSRCGPGRSRPWTSCAVRLSSPSSSTYAQV